MEEPNEKWFEDESFWAAAFPFMFPESRFLAAADDVPKIAALAGVSAGSLLDLACGPGRYAIPFAQAGYFVTGVDRSRFLLQKARGLAVQTGATVEWVEQDMRAFLRPDSFDLVINLFTSFGYFDLADDNRRVLENVHASLKPGGVFVLDHLGKEILAARFQATRSEALADGTLLIQRVSVIKDWTRVAGEWTFVSGRQATSYMNQHWLYSGQEIRELLGDVGFIDVSLYGSLDATPYDPQAQRLVAMARKQRLIVNAAAK